MRRKNSDNEILFAQPTFEQNEDHYCSDDEYHFKNKKLRIKKSKADTKSCGY